MGSRLPSRFFGQIARQLRDNRWYSDWNRIGYE
jgi:hypothetical protein